MVDFVNNNPDTFNLLALRSFGETFIIISLMLPWNLDTLVSNNLKYLTFPTQLLDLFLKNFL